MPRLFLVLFLMLIRCAVSAADTTHTYQRVVSLAPNLTQCIYALGAQDRIVGVSDFDAYPPEVAQKKKTGGWSNPNYEVLRGLNPDAILILGRHEKARQFAEERGIAVESFDVESIAQIRASLLRLGRLLGADDRATSLVAQFDARLARLRHDLDTHPGLKRPRVFLCIGRQEGSLSGLTTVTGGSFLQEALELAGGDNAFADVDGYYPSVSKESLLARRPDIVIEMREGDELSPEQESLAKREWLSLSALPAVRNGQVHVLSAPGLLVPGPRFPQTVEHLRKIIWPKGLD